MSVPFIDISLGIAPLRKEIDATIKAVIDSGSFAGGKFVEKFETEFAAYCGSREAIGVGNGTDALWFALLAAGIGPGDEVITVPNTFAATIEAILLTGATPVFVDINANDLNIDPNLVESAITPRTKAIIPVHLFGRMAAMSSLLSMAKASNLLVIEDACQAHGAVLDGKRAGAHGDLGCFSFYPGKNLGAFGEAGAIVTNNSILAGTIRCLRDHGQSRKYHHQFIGWNGRMDGIQAAVLSCKLPQLDKANGARRLHASRYRERLQSIAGIQLPPCDQSPSNVFHLFAIQVEHREECMTSLLKQGIHCGIHYPVPLHLQPAYSKLGYNQGDFPIAEQAAKKLLSLPMFPELTDSQIHEVCNSLEAHCNEASRGAPPTSVLRH